MTDREEILIFAYFLFLFMDILILSDGRRVLFDFLIGRRNRKSAKKIHGEQTDWDRLTMNYIEPMLKKHKKEFHRFHVLYKVLLYSLVPRFVVLGLVHILFTNAVWYVYGSYFAIQIGISAVYRIVLGANRRSVYAKK